MERSPHDYSSLVAMLDEAFTKYAQRVACIHLGHAVTYEALSQQAFDWAFWLQSLNLPKGSRVAIMLPNVAASLATVVGTLRAGHVVVNVNPLYTAHELSGLLRDSQPSVIVVFETFAHTLQKVQSDLMPAHQIVVRVGDLLPQPKAWMTNFVVKTIQRKVPAWKLPQAQMLKHVLKQGRALNQKAGGVLKPLQVSPQDMAFLQYTGATTGEPKGVMLSHANIVANVLQIHEVSTPALGHLRNRPLSMLTALPLYHIFAMTICGLYALFSGMTITLVINARDLHQVVSVWKQSPPAIVPGVNTLFNALLHNPQFRELDFSSLRLTFGGGMAVQVSVAQAWQALTGLTIVQGYGMSETSPVISAVPMDTTHFFETVGLPLIWTDIQVLDEHYKPVVQGKVGEVAVRGPQVMLGYWQDPAQTQACMTDDGYFLTGDMGLINEVGHLVLVDRKKDMVVTSGFNVYPAEIDRVFSAHPEVLECAAVGFPDAVCGEVVWLFVVPRSENLQEAGLRQWATEHLTPYKCPRAFVFVKSLPKNTVGKTLRRALRAQYESGELEQTARG